MRSTQMTRRSLFKYLSLTGFSGVIGGIIGKNMSSATASPDSVKGRVKHFKTLKKAIKSKRLLVDDLVAVGDRAGGEFEVEKASDFTANSMDVIALTGRPDLVLVLRNKTLPIDVRLLGAKGSKDIDSIIDETDIINYGLSKYKHIWIDEICIVVNPEKSVLMTDSCSITGFDFFKSQILALHDVAGDVIKREGWSPSGRNAYIQNCLIKNVGVFANHVHQATIPENIQNCINLSNVTRSKVEDCATGNYRVGVAAILAPNAASNAQAMRGRAIVLGNVAGSDPAYAGGEVNHVLRNRVWWAQKGIVLDDLELTGGNSASYAALVRDNDIQTVELGIAQQSQYNTGCNIKDNLIQDIKNAAGSTVKTYAYEIGGYHMTIEGGYHETDHATALVHLTSTANNNRINIGYHNMTDESRVMHDDAGAPAQNILTHINGANKFVFREGGVTYTAARDAGFCVFDGTGKVVASHNVVTDVNTRRVGRGDYLVTWAPELNVSESTPVTINVLSNASGHPVSPTIWTQSGGVTRGLTYNVNTTPVLEDFSRTFFTVKSGV